MITMCGHEIFMLITSSRFWPPNEKKTLNGSRIQPSGIIGLDPLAKKNLFLLIVFFSILLYRVSRGSLS